MWFEKNVGSILNIISMVSYSTKNIGGVFLYGEEELTLIAKGSILLKK
jgi:hypothetical protein